MKSKSGTIVGLLAIVVAAAATLAQEIVIPAAVRGAADRITAAQLEKDLGYLASDELRGRNTPSPGYDKAAEYIAKRLERAGLKPAGDDGSYFQRYTMRESSVAMDAFVDAGGKRFRLGDGFVMRSFAGPLKGTLTAVYVGHGWTIPGRGIDPYAGVDVKGKLVVAHGPRAAPKGVDIRQIGRVSVDANSPFVEAERRGAAGVIFVPLTSALKGWSQMSEQNTVLRELEPRVPSAYAATPVTSVLLSQAATEALFAGEQIDGGKLVTLGDSSDYPPSFQLSRPLTVDIGTASTTDHRPYNVVAILEGSDPVLKNEYITIESHLDGAVGTRSLDGDSVYNSADDNASGSAGNLAIAEYMMTAPRPKRSLVFIWDSGEERGLWGTRYFVHRPPVPLDKVVAHINIDMIGANRAPGTPDEAAMGTTGPNEVYLIGPGVLSEQADRLIERVNRGYLNMRFNRDHDRAESEFFYPRTDAGPFLERGILTIGFTTGIHTRYHAPSDEAKYLDPKKMETIARTAFATIWALADASERPRIDKPIPSTVPRYGARDH
jgi:Peptidase family M28